MCLAIREDGLACSLNHIDVSGLTSFDGVFAYSDFVGDISQWDVSAGESFHKMFADSLFNGDISKWNMEKATDLGRMFENSRFAGDLSQWRLPKLQNAKDMFICGLFNGDVSLWNPCNLKNAGGMFNCLSFQGDLSRWTLAPYCNTQKMLHSEYNGALPRPQEDFNAHSYRAMMVNEAALNAYFARTPFSIAHAEMLVHNASTCPWAEPELVSWANDFMRIGSSMDMAHEDVVLALFSAQHNRLNTMHAPDAVEMQGLFESLHSGTSSVI